MLLPEISMVIQVIGKASFFERRLSWPTICIISLLWIKPWCYSFFSFVFIFKKGLYHAFIFFNSYSYLLLYLIHFIMGSHSPRTILFHTWIPVELLYWHSPFSSFYWLLYIHFPPSSLLVSHDFLSSLDKYYKRNSKVNTGSNVLQVYFLAT